MHTTLRHSLASAMLAASTFALPATALLLAPVAAHAQASDKLHVRGSIVSATAGNLKIKTREGKTVDVGLPEGARIAGIGPAAITDIKPGDFVGIASLPKAEGGDGALEVLIFPPTMKGTGEGSYGWDLKPNSSMTNATVANAVKGVDGHTVTVAYHGKEKKIAVADGTPVVTFAAADKTNLVAGAKVFIVASKDAKGALVAQQVVVGTQGIVPPM